MGYDLFTPGVKHYTYTKSQLLNLNNLKTEINSLKIGKKLINKSREMILSFIIKLIDQYQLMITSDNISHDICKSYLHQNETWNSQKKKS